MKKILSFFMAAILLFCPLFMSGCGKGRDGSDGTETGIGEGGVTVPGGDGELPEDVSLPDPTEVISRSTVFIYGCGSVWIRGTEYPLGTPAFLEDGVLFIPVASAAVLLGGSFVRSGDVYYLNHAGNVTVMMEDYNVILVNDTAVVMRSTPKIKDGVFCLPAEGLAKALSMYVSKYPADGICVFENFTSRLKNEMLMSVRISLGYGVNGISENETIADIAGRCGKSYAEIERLAVEGQLYISDGDGVPYAVSLDDGGDVVTEKYDVNASFPKDSVFVIKNRSGKDMMCDIRTGKEISEPPDILYTKELKAATGRFMELKAALDINGDEKAGTLSETYLEVIGGALTSEAYRRDLESPYETGLFDGENREYGWDVIFEKANVGDFLVFASDGAGPEYGFFNHSALIIEKHPESGTLRLLHARGAEYGVGADLDMDYVTSASFENVDYYRSYGTVFLCRAGELTGSEAEKMAADAYEKYNGCQFGYGGRMGLEETNCAELIDGSYLDAGIDIIDGDYDSRLKEVLKGNTKNLVLIPDDLLFSDVTEVIAVWKR